MIHLSGLEIFSQNGSLLEVLLKQDMLKGDAVKVEFDASKYPHSVFIYRITTNLKTVSGTVMKIK